MKHASFGLLVLTATVLFAPVGYAEESIEVDLHKATPEGPGEAMGSITLEEHRFGVLIKPSLKGLSPGLHGFHLHQNPDCGPKEKEGKMTPAAAAGGHYDPEDHGQHQGPYEPSGHLGDLPALFANEEGKVAQTYLAPRLHLDQLRERALVIHEGGDNYSDDPKALGGGGARVACGVINAE